MNSDKVLHDLLRCAIQVIGRIGIPPEKVREIVDTGKRQVKAYNLCDGTLSQSEIAKKAGLDQGNFSRVTARWIEHGVAFWIGEGKDSRLLHLYPIPEISQGRDRRKKSRK
jgi:hypothetical protein